MNQPEGPSDPEQLLKTARFTVVRRSRTTSRGNLVVREVIEHPGAVVVLPLLDDDRVCLVRNYRLAVGQTLLELPAGTLDPGEDPLEAARRELREETGYRAASWQAVHAFWMSPGILRERMHLFVARGLTPGDTALEAGEEISTHIIPWSEALALVEQGRIDDAKTLVGLLLYDRLRNTAALEPSPTERT